MTLQLNQIQNLIEWQIERGFQNPFIANFDVDVGEPVVAFVASPQDLQNSDTYAMLQKIIAAMKLGSSKFNVVVKDEWLQTTADKVSHLVIFGALDLEDFGIQHITTLPSLENMRADPQLKVGAWQQLQALALSLR